MKDLKRIKRILKLLEKIWTKHPELRFGQLIENFFVSGDLYYTGDKKLEKILRKVYKIK